MTDLPGSSLNKSLMPKQEGYRQGVENIMAAAKADGTSKRMKRLPEWQLFWWKCVGIYFKIKTYLLGKDWNV